MVIKVESSTNKLYFHYLLEITAFKDGFVKITAYDNYTDTHDYMFANPETGEIKSYNDVALTYVNRILQRADIDISKLRPKTQYRLYTEPHSSQILDTQLVESMAVNESEEEPKAVIHTVGEKELAKLGINPEDFVAVSGQPIRTTDIGVYHVCECGGVYSPLVGYETSDDIFGYYDTSTCFYRHGITKSQMKANLIITAEMKYEDENK